MAELAAQSVEAMRVVVESVVGLVAVRLVLVPVVADLAWGDSTSLFLSSDFPQSNQPDPTPASSTPQPQSSTPPSTPITVNPNSNPPQSQSQPLSPISETLSHLSPWVANVDVVCGDQSGRWALRRRRCLGWGLVDTVVWGLGFGFWVALPPTVKWVWLWVLGFSDGKMCLADAMLKCVFVDLFLVEFVMGFMAVGVLGGAEKLISNVEQWCPLS
ncbi:hypothetical protein FCV25MIE_24892 [Fagus crenata]